MRVGIVSFSDIDYALDLATDLTEAGIAVSLYMSRSHTARALDSKDRPVERMYELGLLPENVPVRLFELPRIRDPRNVGTIRNIGQAIQKDGVEVVQTLTGAGEIWLSLLALSLRDVAVVSTMLVPKHNVGEHPPESVVWLANKLLAAGSEVVIVNGTDHIAQVREMYGVPADRVCHVKVGPRTTSARWSVKKVSEEPGTVLFCGRIARHKGPEYLVRAQPIISRAVPKARIILAGYGEEEMARCRAMIQDEAAFEIHDGFVPNQLMTELFQRTCLVALPYITASTSGILTTAYVFGKPVVATRVGSLPEYVEDEVTGLLIPPANEEQLAGAIVRLLTDDDLRHRMGQNALRWVEEEQKRVVEETMKAYEKAIARHRRAA